MTKARECRYGLRVYIFIHTNLDWFDNEYQSIKDNQPSARRYLKFCFSKLSTAFYHLTTKSILLLLLYLNKNAGGCAGGLAGILPLTALASLRIFRLTPSTRVAPADALAESRAGGVL
jgi:hypothetical protein